MYIIVTYYYRHDSTQPKEGDILQTDPWRPDYPSAPREEKEHLPPAPLQDQEVEARDPGPQGNTQPNVYN